MKDNDPQFVDLKGGCLTWLGFILLAWLLFELLPFLFIFAP